MLIAGSIVPLVSILYFYIDWRNDIYVLTNRRVVHRERVGAFLIRENFSAAPLQAVQNVQVSQVGIIGRMLKFGDLIIETAGSCRAGRLSQHPGPPGLSSRPFWSTGTGAFPGAHPGAGGHPEGCPSSFSF